MPGTLEGMDKINGAFRDPSNEMPLYFETDEWEPTHNLFIGRPQKTLRNESKPVPNQREILVSGIDLEGVLNRIYCAALGVEPLKWAAGEQPPMDEPESEVDAIPDAAPGFKVFVQGKYSETGRLWLAGKVGSGNPIILTRDEMSIRINISPIQI